jgi:hypothetical protein
MRHLFPSLCFLIPAALLCCCMRSPRPGGRIANLATNGTTFRIGDTVEVLVEVENYTSTGQLYVVVLIIGDSSGPIYNSHLGGTSHSGDDCVQLWVAPHERASAGPFIFQIKSWVVPHTYIVSPRLQSYRGAPLWWGPSKGISITD